MIIYLARHGQTTGDIENRYGGDYEDHLTELGKEQSSMLADQLALKRVEALYASPKIRAQETATIVGQRADLTVNTLRDLRERNGYGIMTGMKKEEAEQRYPEYVAGLKIDVHYNVEGAEPYERFRERITAVLEATLKLPYGRIILVTHGGPIRLIFREILKLGEIEIGDCAFMAIDASDGGYQLLDVHRIKALEP